MKAAGIIAEYNPFHLGHEYQIKKTRKAGATHIAVVMSGNVVQRGDIACFDAFDRADAALSGGADVVFEMSPRYSLGAARDFAKAGVEIFKRLGSIDVLSFGAETANISALKSSAEKIDSEYLKIKELMSQGRTYPQASAEACGEDVAEIISSQNNTLAIEYIRALEGSDIEPLAIKRTIPHDSDDVRGSYASASYIRKIIKRGGDPSELMGYKADLSGFCSIDQCEKAIIYKLSTMSKEQFAEVPYCRELAGRLYTATRRAESLLEIYSAVKSRNFTQARVRRAVLLAALDVDSSYDEIPFVRVLGFNKRGAELLKMMKSTSTIPFGGSLADLSRISDSAQRYAELIERASRLQDLCHRDGESEYKKTAKIRS